MTEENAKAKAVKYRKLTEAALKRAKVCVAKDSHLFDVAIDFLEMARNYFNDAKYFEGRKEFVTAVAAYSYAHAWLDAGARLGLFDVKMDSRLFTLAK
ncbi:MAG: DUF357 domain-containing protein [archaeon]